LVIHRNALPGGVSKPGGAFLLVLGIFLALAMGSASQADAFVYWSQGTAIGRANLDGTASLVSWMSLAAPVVTCDVAVDGSHIYWSGEGAIGRANLDGTDPEPNFISAPNNSCGIEVDGSHIYWANRTAIGRANLDGTNPEPDFIPVAGLFTGGIAVDGSHIYWGNDEAGAIGRANLNGTEVLPNFINAPGDPCAVTVGGTDVYWSSGPSPQGPSGVFSQSMTGKRNAAPKKLIDTEAGCGVAVNSKYLYWAAESPRALGRANLDGSSPNPSFISNPVAPSGLALDSLSIPPLIILNKVQLSPKKGIATIIGHVAVAGQVRLSGKGLRTVAQRRSTAGTFSLPVRPGGGVEKTLTNTGKAKVTVKITFTPTRGSPELNERVVTLRKRS
jgi:hypothetical protein